MSNQTPAPISSPGPARAGVPPGFSRITAGGPFMEANGPLYMCHDGDGARIGLRVEQRHVNPLGQLHGGMTASFCDMVLPLGLHFIDERLTGHFLLTVSLQVDFLAPAPLGCWLEGSTELLRATRSLVFARGVITADGTPCAHASGIFRIGPRIPGDLHGIR